MKKILAYIILYLGIIGIFIAFPIAFLGLGVKLIYFYLMFFGIMGLASLITWATITIEDN